jgi:hypothetical protein
MEDLAQRLAQASTDAQQLEQRTEKLEAQLLASEAEEREMALRLVAAEEQAARLMALYVATYQLHASLDPADVRATIAEITINLLGAEHFVLLLRAPGDDECRIALVEGPAESEPMFARGRYQGGEPMIDATLADGELRVGPLPGSSMVAVVPLAVQQHLVGVLVLSKLLDHRGALSATDRDLLDLLAAHAASALFTAQVHASADRKVRTLETLVKLAHKQVAQ